MYFLFEKIFNNFFLKKKKENDFVTSTRKKKLFLCFQRKIKRMQQAQKVLFEALPFNFSLK